MALKTWRSRHGAQDMALNLMGERPLGMSTPWLEKYFTLQTTALHIRNHPAVVKGMRNTTTD